MIPMLAIYLIFQKQFIEGIALPVQRRKPFRSGAFHILTSPGILWFLFSAKKSGPFSHSLRCGKRAGF